MLKYGLFYSTVTLQFSVLGQHWRLRDPIIYGQEATGAYNKGNNRMLVYFLHLFITTIHFFAYSKINIACVCLYNSVHCKIYIKDMVI